MFRGKHHALVEQVHLPLQQHSRAEILAAGDCLDLGDYRGPFGIDMMVVRSEECESVWLHPCVEINLRRTMGHVALALEPKINMQKVMRIAYDGKHYQLMIEDLTN